jgi:hypothetical protein
MSLLIATHAAPGLEVAPVNERRKNVGVDVTETKPAGEFAAQISFVIAGSTSTKIATGLVEQAINVFVATTLYVIEENGAAYTVVVDAPAT